TIDTEEEDRTSVQKKQGGDQLQDPQRDHLQHETKQLPQHQQDEEDNHYPATQQIQVLDGRGRAPTTYFSPPPPPQGDIKKKIRANTFDPDLHIQNFLDNIKRPHLPKWRDRFPAASGAGRKNREQEGHLQQPTTATTGTTSCGRNNKGEHEELDYERTDIPKDNEDQTRNGGKARKVDGTRRGGSDGQEKDSAIANAGGVLKTRARQIAAPQICPPWTIEAGRRNGT
ncbi:unnamed protein product, partial [Amoebophrya sp. A25]